MNGPELLYQYGVGGAFMLYTLAKCLQAGGVDRTCDSDRRTVYISLVGLLVWLGIHWAWAAAV